MIKACCSKIQYKTEYLLEEFYLLGYVHVIDKLLVVSYTPIYVSPVTANCTDAQGPSHV
jgi:hypothetical protein